jgi:hypothetical protein
VLHTVPDHFSRCAGAENDDRKGSADQPLAGSYPKIGIWSHCYVVVSMIGRVACQETALFIVMESAMISWTMTVPLRASCSVKAGAWPLQDVVIGE